MVQEKLKVAWFLIKTDSSNVTISDNDDSESLSLSGQSESLTGHLCSIILEDKKRAVKLVFG